jgi:predicted transcriptional regulator of viral defense system
VDGQPTADRFQIASKVRPGAYVAHHSAFEYHGYYNQVTNVVNVAVQPPFKPFVFDFLEYQPAHDSGRFGVTQASNGVRVTDVERTVLDGMDGFAKGMGLEELDECLSLVAALSEERLLEYLESYGKQFLYQKAGFFLSSRQREFGLSDAFFDECQSKMGASKRYLVEPVGNMKAAYDSSWHLVVPEHYARQLKMRP